MRELAIALYTDQQHKKKFLRQKNHSTHKIECLELREKHKTLCRRHERGSDEKGSNPKALSRRFRGKTSLLQSTATKPKGASKPYK